MDYIAHINDSTGQIQTVKDHSENTARMCRDFAISELKDMVYAMGMLHDIGKYQMSFQRHINGENIRVEHSTCGAIVAENTYSRELGVMMAYCIAGHHSGIPDGGFPNDDESSGSTLYCRLKRKTEDYSNYQKELELPHVDQEVVDSLLVQDCGRNTSLLIDKYAFFTRYCFSCLTDADSLDTAISCGHPKDVHLASDFRKCLEKVNNKLSGFVCTTELQKARSKLQQQVFRKTGQQSEIYLMNMPTGSGKTLCSIKFALERALKTGKSRIIYVIPYNSIIDQTMTVFEEMFGKDAQILRHQSTFSYEDDGDFDEDYRKAAQDASENWDVSSIIVTTAVQFFESLYADKRGKLRKVHNMADSMLIFDEAHLMPQKYLQPCLQAISFITKYLHSEAVFLTATMPDFRQLLSKYALPNSRIMDLIDDTAPFAAFRKCAFLYIGKQSEESLLGRTMDAPSSLIVVNKKKTARSLYALAVGRKYHLSTYMTSIERRKTIDAIQKDLDELQKDYPDAQSVPENRRITIISTSLIEAGVDLDVHTVFRELTGLDSILQAGGRCNREGRRENANTYIFELEDTLPEEDLGQQSITSQNIAANKAKMILTKYKDASCPEAIREYYKALYAWKDDEIQGHTISSECHGFDKCHGFDNIPFRTYAQHFNIIDNQNTETIVVPCDEESKEIVQNLSISGISKGIARKLQKYTCSVSRQEFQDLQNQHAITDYKPGIWCLANWDYYKDDIGITFEATDYYLGQEVI